MLLAAQACDRAACEAMSRDLGFIVGEDVPVSEAYSCTIWSNHLMLVDRR